MITCALSLATARAGANQTQDVGAPSLPGHADEADLDDMQRQLDDLRARLARAEEETKKASPLSINGYVDFGFFAPNGNAGVGWIRDAGNVYFPQYSNYAWTFLGDLLATTVNTRGEAANLGNAPGIVRFDSVNSGAPSFIVNEVNLRLGYQIADRALLRTSVNFVPRTGREDFSLGDFFDLDIAELEYLLTEDGNTSLFVGKTLPVFGIEYKERKSDQRFGITPSLIGRYTMGPQLGLKIRSKLLHDVLILAGSVTNNSSTTEQFHFYSEIDQNWGKTLNGRVAIALPIGEMIPALAGHRLEIGGSGEWGPQDRATDNGGDIWFLGADLQYLTADFALKAQFIRGHAPGRPDERVWGLDLHSSGYVEVDWQFLPFLGAYGRAEMRDAFVTLGLERAYVTKQARFTGGLRVVFSPRVVLKAEYYTNRQLDDIPQFKADMFTSSLVLAY